MSILSTIDTNKIFDKSNLDWLKSSTIYLTLHGSHAYGTSRPDSDIDMRGIAIPPKRYMLGVLDNFNQAEFNDPYDCVIFDLNKFVKLSLDCNPNAIELLYTETEDHILKSPIFDKLLGIRDLFLSKKARFTFAGYARSQILRIKRHRRWILNPIDKKPERKDFNLPDNEKLIPQHKLQEIEAQIQKKINEWQFDSTGLEQDVRINIKNEVHSILVDLKINQDEFHAYAARAIGLDDNLIECFKKERAYVSAIKDWKSYNKWKEERNQARYELEKKYQYDCYTDDTEFLTDSGWKKYDKIIDSDKLATVCLRHGLTQHKYLGVEHQKFIDKFEGKYSGYLYNLYGYHTDVLVTPNHRLLYRKVERKSHKKYDLVLDEISRMPDTFEIVRSISPCVKNYSNKDIFKNIPISPIAFLSLMGWYLSDGVATFKDTNKTFIKSINVSQKKYGRLHKRMENFHNKWKKIASSSLYEYTKPTGGFRTEEIQEIILSVRDKEIRNKIIKDCGHTINKRIPRWVFGLSRQLMNTLLDAMLRGDGTESRPDNSKIYYSTLRGLADDAQELAFMCGYETSLYGPYPYDKNGHKGDMYQVHINKTRTQFKECIRNQNIKKQHVKNKRIVCFTVPNGTLITRRNGHVGIHGNSKHGMHLVRLYKQCIEVLSGKGLIVKRPDADELLEIRNGAWTYDKLLDWANKQDKTLDKLYKTSSLRKEPDRKKVNNVLMEMIEEFSF